VGRAAKEVAESEVRGIWVRVVRERVNRNRINSKQKPDLCPIVTVQI
jgi:hypothetical protein